MAARNGLTVVVQELLAKGASVLAVDENGEFRDKIVPLLFSIAFCSAFGFILATLVELES